jgi:hypothetical protein
LDALSDSDAVFVFQTASALTTTTGRAVRLTHGAKAAHGYWKIGTSDTLGTCTVMKGTLLSPPKQRVDGGPTETGGRCHTHRPPNIRRRAPHRGGAVIGAGGWPVALAAVTSGAAA